MSDPREGLPPCQTHCVIFEGRFAGFFDFSLCDSEHGEPYRFGVSAGVIQAKGEDRWHLGRAGGTFTSEVPIYLLTDDPDEAQAAFERGAEWVRTGEGP